MRMNAPVGWLLGALLACAAGCGDGSHLLPPPSAPTRSATATTSPTSAATASPTFTTPATATAAPPSATSTPSATATAAAPPFHARSSVEQLLVSEASPGLRLEVRSAAGETLQSGEVDAQGTLIFRFLEPGSGYVVTTVDAATTWQSEPVSVWSTDDVPPDDFYAAQRLGPGFQYITTRDGTQLSVNVILPGPVDEGPYPTLVEYSGYEVSNPTSPQVSTLIGTVLGYAVVGINLRGTGCSGGAFALMEPAQSSDGYDAIEIIARQPWVLHQQVGMFGISYPGIMQLYVAQLRPPGLAAIAPMASIGDLVRGTLYPGGILNDGFATGWILDREAQGQPFGQAWTARRRDAGDQTCIENQRFRGQNLPSSEFLRSEVALRREVIDRLAPETFIERIEVPVFLAGAWQDESVGSTFAHMLGRFTGTDKLHFTITNGGHSESILPAVAPRLVEFFSFYVRREIPALTPRVRQGLRFIGNLLYALPNAAIEPSRFAEEPSFASALAKFEAEPPLRVLFENGAGGTDPGAALPRFEHSFAQWPIESTQATAWYLDEDGRLHDQPPALVGSDSYLDDASLAHASTVGEGGYIGIALPNWIWPQPAAGSVLRYETEPLPQTLVMVGSGSVDLWLQSTAPDTDVQVTLSEVRPDGNEMYVQTGFLRASHRSALRPESTDLRPAQTYYSADATPLPAAEFSLARVEIFPFAHVFRAGSRLRLQIATPGGDHVQWTFAVLNSGEGVTNTIARSPEHPSRLVLPVIPDLEVPAAYPPCPSLRYQYCRPDQPWRQGVRSGSGQVDGQVDGSSAE